MKRTNTVGEKIKSIRLSLGDTMERFGERFNTSKGTVNNWEKGRNLPNKENLLIIAKLGNITVEELLKENKAIDFDEYLDTAKKMSISDKMAIIDNFFPDYNKKDISEKILFFLTLLDIVDDKTATGKTEILKQFYDEIKKLSDDDTK